MVSWLLTWREWAMQPSKLVLGLIKRAHRVSDALALLVRRFVLTDPHFPAKFYPIAPNGRSYSIGPGEYSDSKTRDLPVPPRDLWLGYAASEEEYLENGKTRADCLKTHVAGAGIALPQTARILDFGCASGIMLRWFGEFTVKGEVWGVDIAAKPVFWCQTHICPPFRCITTTAFPHLPFEDNYFDLVYAGSVFTHIADLADMWLMELRRITRNGGIVFLTVHDTHYIQTMMRGDVHNPRMRERLLRLDGEIDFTGRGFSMFAVNRAPGHGGEGHAQVFYDTEFMRRQWGNMLEVVCVIPRALGGPQTGVLLRKR